MYRQDGRAEPVGRPEPADGRRAAEVSWSDGRHRLTVARIDFRRRADGNVMKSGDSFDVKYEKRGQVRDSVRWAVARRLTPH